MHNSRQYNIPKILNLSMDLMLWPASWSVSLVMLHEVGGMGWLSMPWLPMSVLGIAVAFYIGFKNNSSYDRTWEARKIWGGIVNASRAWAYGARDLIGQPFEGHQPLSEPERAALHRQLVYRHVAWLDALRHQLRKLEPWEHTSARYERLRRQYQVPERSEDLSEVLQKHASPAECQQVLAMTNPAFGLIATQSAHLKALRAEGRLDPFAHVKLQNVLDELIALQGKAERIKKFPFPRQYATITSIFAWMFVLFLPLGLMEVFEKMGRGYVWATIPFATTVSWVFLTSLRIGDWSENPFEGLPTDVPISTMSRAIERDLKSMLGETDLPPTRREIRQALL